MRSFFLSFMVDLGARRVGAGSDWSPRMRDSSATLELDSYLFQEDSRRSPDKRGALIECPLGLCRLAVMLVDVNGCGFTRVVRGIVSLLLDPQCEPPAKVALGTGTVDCMAPVMMSSGGL